MSNEITDALIAKSGSRDVRFRVDILRKWARVKSISASGSISYDGTAELCVPPDSFHTKKLI